MRIMFVNSDDLTGTYRIVDSLLVLFNVPNKVKTLMGI